jgi:hypothetical protein
MNTGTAIYQGETIFFSDVIIWAGKASYLIAYNGRQGVCEWVNADQLSGIVYHVATIRAARG